MILCRKYPETKPEDGEEVIWLWDVLKRAKTGGCSGGFPVLHGAVITPPFGHLLHGMPTHWIKWPFVVVPSPSGIEAEVCGDIASRQQHGFSKYGVTVADNPLTPRQWMQHFYEELLDAAVYAKRLMKTPGMDVCPVDDSRRFRRLRVMSDMIEDGHGNVVLQTFRDGSRNYRFELYGVTVSDTGETGVFCPTYADVERVEEAEAYIAKFNAYLEEEYEKHATPGTSA